MTNSSNNTPALVALICGILAIVGGIIPVVQYFTTILAIVAIVCGVPEPMRGVVDAPIARADVGILMRTVSAEGREARTEYNTVAVSPDGKYSMVVLRPLTGRTHQIRVHMSYIGCPLVGDFLYGERSELIDRHALHAARMTFAHPADGRSITVSAPLPDDMLALYEKLIRSSDDE